jgi:hypothetical protein
MQRKKQITKRSNKATPASRRAPSRQPVRPKSRPSSGRSLESLERKLENGKVDDKTFWDSLKEIAHDLYEAGKEVLGDLGLDPADLAKLAFAL